MFNGQSKKKLNPHFIDNRKLVDNSSSSLAILLASVLSDPKITLFFERNNISTLNILKQLEDCFSDTNLRDVDNCQSLYDRVLQRAKLKAAFSGKSELFNFFLLQSILDEPDSHTHKILKKNKLSKSLISKVTIKKHFIDKDKQKSNSYQLQQTINSSQNLNLLKTYKIANQNTHFVGRKIELKQIGAILSKKNKANVLLIGDADSGKSAIIEKLCFDRENGHASPHLPNMDFLSLNFLDLVSDTKYRGELEKNISNVLQELDRTQGCILILENLHQLFSIGKSEKSSVDVVSLLKPIFSNSLIKCIATIRFKEYRQFLTQDHSIQDQFQTLEIKPLSGKDTLSVLEIVLQELSNHHQIQYISNASQLIIKLCNKYIPSLPLLPNAIDLLDYAGAHAGVHHKQSSITIGEQELKQSLSESHNIPMENLIVDELKTFQHLEDQIKRSIYGQDHAISKICDAIKIARAGLRTDNKTMGSFLLVGPTGVGKTALSKTLAELTSQPLLRFDMSEYMEKHTVSTLIGAPPGYAGYHTGGLLTEAIAQTPQCVLLLDEIEKAHPDILNLLLQVMDNGTLTDPLGRKVDFNNVVLIMTSNAGITFNACSQLGFLNSSDQQESESIFKHFSPEFINRIDEVIKFNHLSNECYMKIIEQNLIRLAEQLNDRNITFKFDSKTLSWINKLQYDKRLGARPISRLIDVYIKKPIANEILYGSLLNGGVTELTVKNNAIKLKYSKLKMSTVVH